MNSPSTSEATRSLFSPALVTELARFVGGEGVTEERDPDGYDLLMATLLQPRVRTRRLLRASTPRSYRNARTRRSNPARA